MPEQRDKPRSWVGVDLDGTLATYDGFKGDTAIGDPIMPMVTRVRCLLAAGVDVRLFTARASNASEEALQAMRDWCREHLGREIPITCEKTQGMIMFFDDRARRVQRNTGLLLDREE
jgi:hypothetical protein